MFLKKTISLVQINPCKINNKTNQAELKIKLFFQKQITFTKSGKFSKDGKLWHFRIHIFFNYKCCNYTDIIVSL